jgi:NitT/TauT family transport system substrate-binding protein
MPTRGRLPEPFPGVVVSRPRVAQTLAAERVTQLGHAMPMAGLVLSFVIFAAGVLGGVVPASAQAPEISFAQQFSMGYLHFNVIEREQLLEKHAKDLGLPEVKVAWSTLNSPAAMNGSLLTGSLDTVAGGVPGLLTIWARTQATPNPVKGVAAFSFQPIVLKTRNANVADPDEIASPAVKISVQAMLLQMAAAKQWGQASYARLDPLTVAMSPPDATVALLSGAAGITSVIGVPPVQIQQLEGAGIHTVLSSNDVNGGPHTFTLAWTSSQFRAKYPLPYKALIAAFEEATATLNRDVRPAARYWLEGATSKLSIEEVAQIAAGEQVKWTLAPEEAVDRR